MVVFDSDPSNQSNVLGKTAYYDPQTLEVHIFVDGRHPKDMLRSIAHELIHHHQNMEGRLDVGGYNGPGYYLENDELRVVEEEAMLKGNVLLREYEDGLKIKEVNKMSLKEWKNNELNGLLLKKFGILNEQKNLEKKEELEEELDEGKLPPALQKHLDDQKANEKPKSTDEDEDELEEGRLNARTTNKDKFVGHEDRYRADRIHEADGDLEEGVCKKCGKDCGVSEGSCGGEKAANENLKRSIRSALKENKRIRLRIKK